MVAWSVRRQTRIQFAPLHSVDRIPSKLIIQKPKGFAAIQIAGCRAALLLKALGRERVLPWLGEREGRWEICHFSGVHRVVRRSSDVGFKNPKLYYCYTT